MGKERLHKILSGRGVASRRTCEKLIAAGRVTVDGQVVRRLGTKVAPEADIRVDGEPVAQPRKVYYILNKPRGVVTTLKDESDRKSVGDLVGRLRNRVYPAGRLDRDSEGLLLVTNDGRITNVLTHPRYEIEKTYSVKVRGRMSDEAVAKLTSGVRLREGRAAAKVRVLSRSRDTTSLLMTISTGYNRQIRRMCAAVGHNVTRLKRTAIGPLRLKGLSKGEFRRLKADEVAALKKAVRRAERRVEGDSREGLS